MSPLSQNIVLMQMIEKFYLTMAKRRMVKRKGVKRKPSKFSKAIQSLQRMKGDQRCNAIRFANDKFIRDIVSHVKKLRTRKVSAKDQKLLKRYSTKLRFISSPKVSLQKKRQTLTQKGGFLPLLLPILTLAIGAMIAKSASS